MPKRDSIDKVVTSYFAAVNAQEFEYKGTVYPVRGLTVSPMLLRGFECPAGCGGCCPTFTLDYLPEEEHPYALEERFVKFNGRSVLLHSDTQETRIEHHCGNLRMEDGRCGVHGRQPFSCDFELIRFLHPHTGAGNVRMLTKLFGRGHAMLRVDDERGALCRITPATEASRDDVVRKLRRLEQWCDYFHLKNRVRYIIEWAQRLPEEPLTLEVPKRQNLF